MGFVSDEEKGFEEGMKANAILLKERRQKNRKIIVVLTLVAIIGGSFVLRDYLGRMDTDDIFSEDQEVQKQIVEKWSRVGFIISLDVASKLCFFNEDRWRVYSAEEKIRVTQILGWYCAKKSGDAKPSLTIKGSLTGTVVATMGEAGVELR